LLTDARRRIAPRLQPGEAHEARVHGAVLVDLRSEEERRREGIIPGSVHVPRSVLEWRVDPESGYANAHLGGLDTRLILFCADGFSSTLAAATLRELGCERATDLAGGFAAWKAAGLPVRVFTAADEIGEGDLPGMGGPAPLDSVESRKESGWQST
jgi:rhodanese-related sulfurtransferase